MTKIWIRSIFEQGNCPNWTSSPRVLLGPRFFKFLKGREWCEMIMHQMYPKVRWLCWWIWFFKQRVQLKKGKVLIFSCQVNHLDRDTGTPCWANYSLGLITWLSAVDVCTTGVVQWPWKPELFFFFLLFLLKQNPDIRLPNLRLLYVHQHLAPQFPI